MVMSRWNAVLFAALLFAPGAWADDGQGGARAAGPSAHAAERLGQRKLRPAGSHQPSKHRSKKGSSKSPRTSKGLGNKLKDGAKKKEEEGLIKKLEHELAGKKKKKK